MNLRPYQNEAIRQINNAYIDGINKQVIVLATGLGKTVIFSSLASRIIDRTDKKVLVIAHREELLAQAKDKINTIDPMLRVDIEQAQNYADLGRANVVVASVQTIGRQNTDRIQRFDPLDFSMVVIDEAHHAPAESYKNVLRHFGLLKVESEGEHDWNKECLLLGVTATPNRADNKGIEEIFDKTTFKYTLTQGIKDKFLSDIKAHNINTQTDLTQVKRTAGDFNLGQLAEAINNDARNDLIIKTYHDLARGRQALCFASDVSHTIELTNRFREAGINASYVVGDTDKKDREERLNQFANGEIQVMVNAMVLTEGYDNPAIETILMARPTQSGILFQQMIGRGTRLYENKDHLQVIDFVDNTSKKWLQSMGTMIGLPGHLNFKGRDILKAKEEVDELLDLAPNVDLEALDIDKIQYAIQEVDLLAGLKIPDELEGMTTNDWHQYAEDEYRVQLAPNQDGTKRAMNVYKTITGEYSVNYISTVKEHLDGVPHPIYTDKTTEITTAPTIEKALYEADKYIAKEHSESLILIQENASWRSAKPSDKQLNLLRKFKVSETVLNELNKGQASRLITKLINKSRRGLV